MSMVVGVATLAGGSWGVAATARHRAEVAADLAALAAAGEVTWGGGEQACATAARIATENGSQLDRCGLVGDVVEIRVRRTFRFGGLPARTSFASARAGPAP